MKKWEALPDFLRKKEVRPYYEHLQKCKWMLAIKRIMDFFLALLLAVFLMPCMIVIGILIKCDSSGPVLFKQIRITKYGRKFYIYKFRTMINGADKKGAKVTAQNDSRITKVGKVLRKYRIDEIPQLFNILLGDMSFVGTRPEVEKYVQRYTNEMRATLLLPAGITSLASIRYKDEENLLNSDDDIDMIYVQKILPEKMKYNLEAIKNFNIVSEIKVMIYTVLAVMNK